MEANQFWTLFLQTGAPEAYLLYKQAIREQEAVMSA